MEGVQRDVTWCSGDPDIETAGLVAQPGPSVVASQGLTGDSSSAEFSSGAGLGLVDTSGDDSPISHLALR